MKTPREPRTVTINHLSCSKSRRSLMGLGRSILTDYDTPDGTVVEILTPGRPPRYKFKDTGETVSIKFYKDLKEELYYYTDPEIFE